MKMLTDEHRFGDDDDEDEDDNVSFHTCCECKYKILVNLGRLKKCVKDRVSLET